MNKIRSMLRTAAALLLCLCLPLPGCAAAYADSTIYTIDDVQDLLDLQEKCMLNSYSRGRHFVLTADLDLTDTDFTGIVSFSGELDGCGHSIRGFVPSDDSRSCAFFGTVESGALIKNLHLEADICPENDCDYTAGLAAVNLGTIRGCSFSGSLLAKDTAGGIAAVNGRGGLIEDCLCSADIQSTRDVGGIAGHSLGTIRGCRFEGTLNTGSGWVDGEGLDLAGGGSLEPDTGRGRNIGGIAGINEGLLAGCTNDGAVGYKRSGENVGGIAGLHSGSIQNCTNNGRVCGKDDVGGIAGQMVPYIEYEEGKSYRGDIESLQDITDRTLDDIDALTGSLSDSLDQLSAEADKAIGAADSAADSLTDTTDRNIDTANQLLDRLDYLEDELPGALDHLSEALEQGRHLSRELDTAKELLQNTEIFKDGYLSDPADRSLVLESTAGGRLTTLNLTPRAGDRVTISILADPGYSLKSLSRSSRSGSEMPVDVSGLNGRYSFTMPEEGAVLSAEFQKDTAYYVQSSAGGSIALLPGRSALRITVLPEIGYACTGLSVDGDPISGTTFSGIVSVPLPADPGEAVIVCADFSRTAPENTTGPALIACSSSVGGSLLCSDLTPTAGEEVLFTLVPADGYTASGLRINGEDKTSQIENNKLKYTLPADAAGTIRAEADFAPVIVSIQSNCGGDASCTVSGGKAVIRALPDTGRSAELASLQTEDGQSVPFAEGGSAASWCFDPIPGQRYTAQIRFSAVKNRESAQNAAEDLQKERADIEDSMALAEEELTQIRRLITDEDGRPLPIRSLDAEKLAQLEERIAALNSHANECLSSSARITKDISDLSVLTAAMLSTAKDVDTDALDSTLEDIRRYADKMSSELQKTADKSSDILRHQGRQEELKIEGFGDALRSDADDLKDSLSRMNDIIRSLNKDIDRRSEDLRKDLQSGSDRLADVLYGLSDQAEDIRNMVDEGRLYTDRSAEKPNCSNAVRTADCRNNGPVDGCRNIGGIAGSMDAELLSSLDDRKGLTGDAYSVLSGCSNYGHIRVKNGNGAGIAGLHSLGLIRDCFSAGSVLGTEAEALGGIAGSSTTCIRDCSSMAVLEGKQYVGGIAGRAEDVSGCLSLARIGEDARRSGAILGSADQKENSGKNPAGLLSSHIRRNYFASTGTQGIDGASYSGAAEPVSYEQLCAMDRAPEAFKDLKLICLDEDLNVILQQDLFYGQPAEAPLLDGMPAEWDGMLPRTADGSIVLRALEPELSPVLESSASVDGRPAGLAGGSFGKDAVLDIRSVSEEGLPAAPAAGTPVYYRVSLTGVPVFEPGDIRLHAGDAEKIHVFRLSEGGDSWEELPAQKNGSYVQIRMEHSSELYCLLAEEQRSPAAVLAGGGAAAAAALAAWLKKKKTAPKDAQ